MPFVFLILGLLFLVVAVRGTHTDFFGLVKSEFTGPNNFIVWAAALIIIGAVGFVRPLKPVANAFLLLILLVIVLRNGTGFFDRFNAALAHPAAPSSGAASKNVGGTSGGMPGGAPGGTTGGASGGGSDPGWGDIAPYSPATPGTGGGPYIDSGTWGQ